MKVSASKKTIVILSVCFVSLLLSGLTLLYKDVIYNGFKYGRWFTLGEDDELLDDCEWEREGINIKVRCEVFLKYLREDRESEENRCIAMERILKDGKTLSFFMPCLKTSNIDLSDYKYNYIYNSYFPVIVSFKYRKRGLFRYNISSAYLKGMTHQKTEELRENFQDIAPFIRTEKDGIYENDNYYFVEEGFDGKEYPLLTYLKGLTLKEITIKDSSLLLSFEGEIKKTNVNLRIENDEFLFLSRTQELYTISKDSHTKLEIDKEYQLTFFSLPSSTEEKIPEILSSCKESEKELFMELLCKKKEEGLKNAVIEDREKYFDELLKDPKNIKLGNFIPYIFSLN